MVGDEEKPIQSCRPSLKTPFSNYANWKSKLRENCFKRVREDRTRLLWKLRFPEDESKGQSSEHKDVINSTLQEIVSDELRKIKETSLDVGAATIDSGATDDMIWIYDGLQTAYQGDCEEILLEMQRIFYEDLGREESRQEPDNFITTWEDEEDEYLARMVYDHMQLSSDQIRCAADPIHRVREAVWCPICKSGKLQENAHHINCNQCSLKLKRGLEVDLDFLQLRLAEAHMDHLDGGCKLRPEFCVETKFELTALYIKCQGCKIFDIVL